MEDASPHFRTLAYRLYPKRIADSLCVIERLVRQHEARTGKPVVDFGGYLRATSLPPPVRFDSESRTLFEAWQRVREKMG